MKHTVITITKDCDGEVIEPVGCLQVNTWNGQSTACGTLLESDLLKLEYTTKQRKVGGITCSHCLELIEFYKKILL